MKCFEYGRALLTCALLQYWELKIYLHWSLFFVLNRMFAQLRPYGTLILEPQSLASYSKKARKINTMTKDNFNNMKFKPNQFVEYLINDVGFSGGEIIGTPQHSALGFRRAIYVSFFFKYFHKIVYYYLFMKLFSSSITGIQKAINKHGCIWCYCNAYYK